LFDGKEAHPGEGEPALKENKQTVGRVSLIKKLHNQWKGNAGEHARDVPANEPSESPEPGLSHVGWV